MPTQRILYNSILGVLHTDTLYELICSRIGTLAPSCSLQQDDFKHACKLLFKLPHSAASHIWKSWVNAWATTHRMHEPCLLQCIFGCEAPDALEHYLVCNPMWNVLQRQCQRSFSLPLPSSPLARLGLSDPSLPILGVLSACFHAYHHTRKNSSVLQSNLMSLSEFLSGFMAYCTTLSHLFTADLN